MAGYQTPGYQPTVGYQAQAAVALTGFIPRGSGVTITGPVMPVGAVSVPSFGTAAVAPQFSTSLAAPAMPDATVGLPSMPEAEVE